MSFLKKLFSADPEALERKADALYAEGDYGPAKLAYDKARGRIPRKRGGGARRQGPTLHRWDRAAANRRSAGVPRAGLDRAGRAGARRRIGSRERRVASGRGAGLAGWARGERSARAGRSARDDGRRAHRFTDGSVGGGSSGRVRRLWRCVYRGAAFHAERRV